MYLVEVVVGFWDALLDASALSWPSRKIFVAVGIVAVMGLWCDQIAPSGLFGNNWRFHFSGKT